MMAKAAVSRDHFRSFFAIYIYNAARRRKHEALYRLGKVFSSTETISDNLLALWSERADQVGLEAAGSAISLRAKHLLEGTIACNSAGEFVRVVLRDLGAPAG